MEVNTHHTTVQKTARYTTYGTLSKDTKYLWIVLHGSNMLCEQMLYKFANFNPDEHFVIAPEALSRFYKDGFGGDVVAAWMTSRDRLEEISDFSNYLSSLLESYQAKLSHQCKTIAMGFSQGGTTLYRWLHRKAVSVDMVLGYACWIPEDIDLKASLTPLQTTPHIYTYGTADQYLTSKKIAELHQIIASNQLSVNLQPYAGTHRVDKRQLKLLFDLYIAKQES